MKVLFTALFAALLLNLTAIVFGQTASNSETIRAKFEKQYAAWSAWADGQTDHALLTMGTEYHDLVALGPTAAPYFADKMLNPENTRFAGAMAEALEQVTDRHFAREEWPEGKYLDSATRVELYSKWWGEGRKHTRSNFDRLYGRWKELKAKGGLLFKRDVTTMVYDDVDKTVKQQRTEEETELSQVYNELGDMGVDILPFIVEKFKSDDDDMLPIFRSLTHYGPRGKNTEERTASCIKWWEANKGDWLIPVN